MKKIFFPLLASVFLASLFCDVADDFKLLSSIDELVSFDNQDLSAIYDIETRSPEGSISTKQVMMNRRDSEDKFLIRIRKPELDKGKGYLKIGDALWLYEPKIGKFTFTSAKDRFQNTALRNSDFASSNYARDYKIVERHEETLGKFECRVLTLEATSKSVTFPKRILWVDDGCLVRKIEDYSLSGQKLRTIAIPSYQHVGEKWVPISLTVLDHLMVRRVNGKETFERTNVKVTAPSLKPLSDMTYTKDYLQKMQ